MVHWFKYSLLSLQGKDILFTYNKDSEDTWQWSITRQDNGELIDIGNIFIPQTGRLFSFMEIGVYKVDVKSSYGKYECAIHVAESGIWCIFVKINNNMQLKLCLLCIFSCLNLRFFKHEDLLKIIIIQIL